MSVSSIKILAVLAAAVTATSASAATIFLSESNAVKPSTQTIGNPVVNLAIGETKKLYVWALPATTDGILNGIGLSGTLATPGKASVTGTAVYNPENPLATDANGDSPYTRWQGAPGTGTTTANGFSDWNMVTVTLGTGIRNNNSGVFAQDPLKDAQNAYLLGEVSFTGSVAGQSAFSLSVGNGKITSKTVSPLPIFFGSGEGASIPGNVPGGTGQVADAIINVTGGDIPEPATLSLAALGGLAAIRRRRA